MEDNLSEEITLKPSAMKETLAYMIRKRKPVMLVGKPGIGKTDVVMQAAAEAGAETLVIHPVLGDPTDGKGLPWAFPNKDYAVMLPLEEAYIIINAKGELVVFLDDFGQAMMATQASWMQPILGRRMAGRPIPEGVTFIAATNERNHRAGVSGIIEPVKGRFTILRLRADVDDFCLNLYDRGQSEYGLDEDTICLGAVFIKDNPLLLDAFEPTADMTNSPTPRNWVEAFSHTMSGLSYHSMKALVAGRVGTAHATTFMSYWDLAKRSKAINLDAILLDPHKAAIPEKTSEQWCVSVGLASKATDVNFKQIAIYLERMGRANLGEFATLCAQRSVRTCPRITATNDWQQFSLSPVGKMMRGQVD